MTKVNIYDPIVYEEIERRMYKFKDGFDPRFAFGCLVGFYKSNCGSPDGIKFFEAEIIRTKEYISDQEAFELIVAASHNTQLSKEHLNEFITEHLKPIVL